MPGTQLFKSLAKSKKRSIRELTDVQLLRIFVRQEDDRAFEELVRRHGPLVMGVCQRVLHHDQDTEDAFQATFLILARKANSIRSRQSVASWLYKVAWRISLRARTSRSRQKTKEAQANCDRGCTQPARQDADLPDLIDEEVKRLPEKYRAPVLMCYLQGRTNEEAARELRCPTGTVKVRLMRARQLLRKRLARRGIGLSLAMLLVGWTESARAEMPAVLADYTVDTCRQAFAGGSLAMLGLSSATIRLVEGSLRRLAFAKIKLSAALLLLVALLLGADQLLQQAKSATLLPSAHPAVKPQYRPDSFSHPIDGNVVRAPNSDPDSSS